MGAAHPCPERRHGRPWADATAVGGSAAVDGWGVVRAVWLRVLAQGTKARVICWESVLGHSTIRLTMDTYGHVLPDRMHAAADALDRLLGL
jgi:hypothetical protein